MNDHNYDLPEPGSLYTVRHMGLGQNHIRVMGRKDWNENKPEYYPEYDDLGEGKIPVEILFTQEYKVLPIERFMAVKLDQISNAEELEKQKKLVIDNYEKAEEYKKRFLEGPYKDLKVKFGGETSE